MLSSPHSNQALIATNVSNPFVATPELVVDPNWYVDSGASNHTTSNLNNMTHLVEYGGNETIKVGNGNVLPISHVGLCNLTSNAGSLNLKNVLCASNITKNLISVSKLAQDNIIFIEFHVDYCLVNDIHGQGGAEKGTQ